MQDKDIKDDPDYYTLELRGYSYAILDIKDKDYLLEAFNKDKKWAEEEFAERISKLRLNPGEAWKLRSDIWNEFLHDDKLAYTYSERIGDQVDKLINEFKKNPSTRQAYLSIWNPDLDIDKIGKERVPCTLGYHFMIRNDKMECRYMIRSNDLFTHWANDVWLAITLQEYIASFVGVQVGRFEQYICSLHSYLKDLKNVF
ncbi:MAG: thymidylate synthase [Nanoarchaeota archaeon]